MIRSRIANLAMAVGLVMIYFFLDGLSLDMRQAYLQISEKEDNRPVVAQEIKPVQVDQTTPTAVQMEDQAKLPGEVEEAAKQEIPTAQVESQGFYAPNQDERVQLLSPVGDRPSLSEIPLRLLIPAINLDAPIISVQPQLVQIDGVEFMQWLSPDEYAAGWHETSARLGETGNTVLNGHHNINGEVFRRLVELAEGDQLKVFSDRYLFTYQITNKMILPEKYEALEVRLKNAQWILPSQDERLTLITCWPYESNTHRLVIVASPVSVEALPDIDQELLPRIQDGSSSDDGD